MPKSKSPTLQCASNAKRLRMFRNAESEQEREARLANNRERLSVRREGESYVERINLNIFKNLYTSTGSQQRGFTQLVYS